MKINEPASKRSGLLRIRLDIAYDGTNFSGFGTQPHHRTVQGELNKVLKKFLFVGGFQETKNLSLTCVLLAFIAGSIGISLTNGGIGSYPLLVGLVVAYFLDGMPKDEAFAIGNALGLIVWVSQTVLLILVGLISWIVIPKNNSNE